MSEQVTQSSVQNRHNTIRVNPTLKRNSDEKKARLRICVNLHGTGFLKTHFNLDLLWETSLGQKI